MRKPAVEPKEAKKPKKPRKAKPPLRLTDLPADCAGLAGVDAITSEVPVPTQAVPMPAKSDGRLPLPQKKAETDQ
jgi:hypothetical protein